MPDQDTKPMPPFPDCTHCGGWGEHNAYPDKPCPKCGNWRHAPVVTAEPTRYFEDDPFAEDYRDVTDEFLGLRARVVALNARVTELDDALAEQMHRGDVAEAEVERLRPVVEAAEAFARCDSRHERRVLTNAVDAYRAASSEQGASDA